MNKSILTDFIAGLPRKALIGFGITLLIIISVEIFTTSMIPYTRKIVIDALVLVSWNTFLLSVLLAFANSVTLNAAQSLKTWTSQRIALMLRESLMNTMIEDWTKMEHRVFIPNPCSRLNDDVRLSTETLLVNSIEILISVCIVLGLLMSILKWPLLFISAVVYSSLSILIAMLFKKRMTKSKYDSLGAEGVHRVLLTRISFGDIDENRMDKWYDVKSTFIKWVAVTRNYKMFNAVQAAIMYSLPFLIMAPDFFAHKISLGDVTQGTLTFDLLVLNATIWVQLYPVIIDAQAALLRVKELYNDVHK